MVVKRESWILISLKHTHTQQSVYMCRSRVSFTCINSIPTVSMHSYSLRPSSWFPPSLFFLLPLPLLPTYLLHSPLLQHIFLNPSPVPFPLRTISLFPTSGPTSLFTQACPSIPSSTHLSIQPIPHSPFPNPAEGDPRHPVHPFLPCLKAPSSLSFSTFSALWSSQMG